MKNKKRLVYTVIIILTIVTGLLVRIKKEWFPDVVNLYLGDALYAFMMYYIVSFVFVKKKMKFRGLYSLIICYIIEFNQLYQADWINTIRQTIPGKLILGSGFLDTDLLAYLLGVVAALCVDYFLTYKNKTL